MRNHKFIKNIHYVVVVYFLNLVVLTSTASAQATAEPICVPQLPTTSTMTLDADTTTDWDTFAHQAIAYANDPGGNLTTRLIADATYLYFYTEVKTSLADPEVQIFFIGIDAPGGSGATAQMLQITPFLASDTVGGVVWPASLVDPGQIQTASGTWTAWGAGTTPPLTDFSRKLDNSPEEKWILEGRITLPHIGLSTTGGTPNIDHFDLFLYIQSGPSTSTVRRYWPDQGPGFVDIPTPSSLNFGDNRCPDIEISEPFLNF